MKKSLLLPVLLFCSTFIFSSDIFAQKNQSGGKSDSKSVAEVESVSFDKSSVESWCPVSLSSVSSCWKDTVNVEVRTVVKNAGNENWTYYYFVSGGKIIGEGANVVWDLLDAKIGKHTLMVGIGRNNLIYGQIITKTISLQECSVCDLPCACPIVDVSGPTENAKPGDSMIFTASVTGADKDIPVSYKWTISSGTIEIGQGTPTIIVKTDSAVKKGSVTATVELGDLCTSCPTTTASKTVLVTETKP